MNNCPVCEKPYNESQQKCSFCHWYLNLHPQNRSLIGITKSTINDEDFRKIEHWARNAWKTLNRYKTERNEHRKELQQFKESSISDLIKKVDYLTEQLPNLSTIDSQIKHLKEDLISELDHYINSNLQQLLEKIDFDSKFSQLESSILTSLSSQKQLNDSNIKVSPIEPLEELEEVEEFNQFTENINQESLKNSTIEITHEEQSLINAYYNNTQYLMSHIYKVVPTKQTVEDIYLNKANEIIFQSSNQSDYWVIQLQSGTYYLLPDLNLKVNTNIKTIRMIFNLQNYIEHESKNFTLIKSAKVFSNNETEWKLIEKGILQF